MHQVRALHYPCNSSSINTAANCIGIPVFSAKFNRHTGAFAKTDARDPSHLSEFERAKRMSEFYFDVGAWEQQLAEQGGSIRGGEDAQTGEKRKRLTKKDMVSFPYATDEQAIPILSFLGTIQRAEES